MTTEYKVRSVEYAPRYEKPLEFKSGRQKRRERRQKQRRVK